MSYMSQKLWAVASSLLELIPHSSHDKSIKAKKFIITHLFTQPMDSEYQTSVLLSNYNDIVVVPDYILAVDLSYVIND